MVLGDFGIHSHKESRLGHLGSLFFLPFFVPCGFEARTAQQEEAGKNKTPDEEPNVRCVLHKESKRSARFEWTESPRARFLWWPQGGALKSWLPIPIPSSPLFGQFNSVYLGICGVNGVKAAHNAASHLSAAARLLNWA